ncbi:MAG: modA [Anaerosporomusa subterranea]|nr:modA [Anaerosporomusa subterranea]
MKKMLWCGLFLLLTAMLVAGCWRTSQGLPESPSAPVTLNISAAVSLKDVLAEIKSNYQAKTQIELVYNFGASGTLQKQIEQGVPADLFISAAPKQMDDLIAKSLVIKETRRNLATNRLVLIVPQNSDSGISGFQDLIKGNSYKFAMGEPEIVPAGQYARQVLSELKIWEEVRGKAVFTKDVRTVLAYVETGNVEAGIVYKTDAVTTNKVRVVETAPQKLHQPIVYPVAIVTSTKQKQAAEKFMEYLLMPESKAVFEKYGFSVEKQKL